MPILSSSLSSSLAKFSIVCTGTAATAALLLFIVRAAKRNSPSSSISIISSSSSQSSPTLAQAIVKLAEALDGLAKASREHTLLLREQHQKQEQQQHELVHPTATAAHSHHHHRHARAARHATSHEGVEETDEDVFMDLPLLETVPSASAGQVSAAPAPEISPPVYDYTSAFDVRVFSLSLALLFVFLFPFS